MSFDNGCSSSLGKAISQTDLDPAAQQMQKSKTDV